jgi:nucleotide-binding universal stress UspA family protein
LSGDGQGLAIGTVIDGFRIEGKLHEGGMAVLYAVSHAPDAGPLVMKVPKLGFGSHPACYVGFEVEQMILSLLTGPHVPRLVAKGDLEHNPYLVMERITGPSLSEYARRAPLPPQETARLMSATAAAVHDLHRQNVIHLDLKPANVLFRPTGEAVLIDFGLARHAELPDLVEEEFHAPVGTGAYISPEQLAGNRLDPRSDIFALGVIAYLLVTAAKPFGEPTSLAGMRRRLYWDPTPPRAITRGVPEWLQEVLLRCLEVRAMDRYATAAQIAQDLAHPDQVPLTERATRARGGGAVAATRRWLRAFAEPPAAPITPASHMGLAPHVLVALDLDHRDEALAQAMRDALRRTLIAEPNLRVTLLAVREPMLFTEEERREITQQSHLDGLVEMRHWASPLALGPEKARYHVMEGTDPAATLLDYAATHHVDRIIMGARGGSALRRYLGSVSAKVVAEAKCSVSVIRPRRESHG